MIVGGALLGAAAAGTDIWEKSEAGVLTSTDVLIDVIMVVGSLAAAGATASGSIIASSALKTGGAARFATFLDARVYLPLLGATLVTNTVQFVVMAASALEDYREVMATGDEAARDLAGKRLVAQLLVTGGITLLALKGSIADFRRGRNLYLDVDLGREAIARPLLSEAELNALLKRPGISNPETSSPGCWLARTSTVRWRCASGPISRRPSPAGRSPNRCSGS